MTAERASLLPEYTVRRSARAKRSRLTITDDGHAAVVLPTRAPQREADELVARHQGWIGRHQRLIRDRVVARAARPPLGAGREVLLRGVPHRVVSIAAIDGRRRRSVEALEGRIVVITPPLDTRPIADILQSWLRAEARRAVEARLQARSIEMGLAPTRVTIRDQRTRWGSASRRGTLSFGWRLMMCPPSVLDYVVVHELAHLRVAGHGRSFWRLVDRHFPESAVARRWLHEHHEELRHALD